MVEVDFTGLVSGGRIDFGRYRESPAEVDRSIFQFKSPLWLYPGEGGWFFVTLPDDIADEIDDLVGERAGFGSIPVEVTIGASTWKTSLFPDKKSASFVLPVKKAIRAKEGLDQHSLVEVRLRHDPGRT